MASTVDLDQPPLAPPVKYTAHFGTRWQKEKAAADPGTLEFPEDPGYIGQWVIGECIGKGASGRVRIAKHRRTGQLAAVKILPLHPVVSARASLSAKQARLEKQRLGIDREIIMMKLMNHPNILRIYDVFEGERQLYLVLEYVEGGELFDFLVNCGRLPSLEALSFFKQIVYGLNYAHTFSIIHRDLKPENILIHSLNPPLIKIADWGMAAFAPPTLQLETSCGSPHYASPEIVSGLKYKGSASDIWSCGVILFALLAGRLPFDDNDLKTLLSKVKAGKYTIPVYFDPEAKDLLTRMLVVDVNSRITIPEIMAHPWFHKPTPGIIYTPAPSIDELALPLASASSVDSDLLESLRIIWGKHGDIKSIKADLLSPAGKGTLAKAFYFLLQQYREQTLKDHGIILDVDDKPVSPGVKVITKRYKSPPLKKSIEDDAMAGHSGLQSSRYLLPASRTPSPGPLGLVIPPFQGSSCNRPASPIGPRPIRVRPVSFRVRDAPTRHRSMKVGHVADPEDAPPKLSNRARVSMVSILHPRANHGAHSYLSHNQPMFQPLTAPSNPIFAVENKQASANSIDIEMQSGTGSDVDWVNIRPCHDDVHVSNQAQTFRTPTRWYAKTSDGSTSPRGPRVNYGRYKTGDMDKENQQHNLQQPYPESNIIQAGGRLSGVRLNRGRVGRELCNTLYDTPEVMKEKEKKTCPPALALPAHSSKRVSGLLLQSSSPVVPPILASPVGEVKGWFSNLFNWKGHTYVLYSTDTMHSTRKEVIRILEGFGVIVCPEVDGHAVLRCRTNEPVDMTSGSVGQKQVQFRVEFSSSQEQWRTRSSQLGAAASPRSPGSHHVLGPMSPTFWYGSSKLSLDSGFACAIVLVQEKGSVSSFRTLCKWLKEEWALDDLRSPVVGAVETPRSAM